MVRQQSQMRFGNSDNIILHYANNVLNNSQKPEHWWHSHLKPLPKSGDLSEAGNSRVITLSAIEVKITNKLLLSCIKSVLNTILRSSQNGFPPSRSTTSYTLALRRLLKGVKSQNPASHLWTLKKPLTAYRVEWCWSSFLPISYCTRKDR